MKGNKLQKSILIGFLLLAICLVVGICSIVGLQHVRNKIDDIERSTFSYTRAAADFIDGDRIEKYIETGKKDEYYNSVMSYLNSNLKNSNMLYYYVFVPHKDDLVYVWDADAAETPDGTCELGDHEKYMSNGKETLKKIYRKNPEEKITFEHDDTYGYIASAYSPIFNSEGDPVALVGADVYFPNVQHQIIISLIMIAVAIILMILIAIIVFFYVIRKKVVEPISELNSATKKMVDNLESDSEFKIDIETGNEIEELAESFEHMYEDVRVYIDQLSTITAEKERIGAELNVATKIQASLLPCIFPAFPDRKDFEIFATMNPAKEVGGDFYDFFMIDDENIAIVMADVSGKGVPAALFMVIGKTLIREHTVKGKDLGDVFTDVNRILCESNSEQLFITAFVGVLNLKTGIFQYVNAGHEPPFIYKNGEEFTAYKIRPGFVLAGMEGIKYKSGEMQLEPGDKIFQYTDGVTEANRVDKELFGMNRLEKTLNELKAENPEGIIRGVKNEIDEFAGEALQFDDITMLCLEYHGHKE